MKIKNINIQVNTGLYNNKLGIKCDADKNLTVGDFIRVVDSLGKKHIAALQNYSLRHPEVNIEQVTFKDLSQ